MPLISSGILPEYRQISGQMLVLTFSADSCQPSFSPGVTINLLFRMVLEVVQF